MQHTSIVQIFKVNEARSGVKDGRSWDMQDAECALITPEGEIHQVGVLRIPRHLRETVKVGYFTASFSLQASMKDRRIESVLTGLTPLPAGTAKPAPKTAGGSSEKAGG